MDDICIFIPPDQQRDGLEFIHFVYEANLKKLRQPFVHSITYMQLVVRGEGVLQTDAGEFELQKGDLFFTFPNQTYRLIAGDEFTFLYISFAGERAEKLLHDLKIHPHNCIFSGMDGLSRFWMDAIIQVTPGNAGLLAESVFTYTLSQLTGGGSPAGSTRREKMDIILDYIHNNFTSRDMSVKKLADLFFYNEKYLSALFVKKTGRAFSGYVSDLRIRYAVKLMEDGAQNLMDIAGRCGFADQFYFSKVFKRTVGRSPGEYIRRLADLQDSTDK